jgi:hypothetical protein
MSTNECDQLVGASTNKHKTKQAAPEATAAAPAPAPAPSEPPPAAGVAATTTAATRYEGSVGDTNMRRGINVHGGCTHECKVSAGCTNERGAVQMNASRYEGCGQGDKHAGGGGGGGQTTPG